MHVPALDDGVSPGWLLLLALSPDGAGAPPQNPVREALPPDQHSPARLTISLLPEGLDSEQAASVVDGLGK